MDLILNLLHFQLKDSLKNISYISSPNFNKRAANTVVNSIIIHYSLLNEQETIAYFTDSAKQVSAHYMINRLGKITAFVEPQNRAWHAGESSWLKYNSLNDNSIGIELVNNGLEEFTKQQYYTLIKLIKFLKQNFPIEDKLILGHSDIAPQRKNDPGPLFNWQILHQNNLGIYARKLVKNNKIICQKGDQGKLVLQMQKSLSLLGYQILIDGFFGIKTANVIYAFKTHYNPESLSYAWDVSSEHVLRSLLKKGLTS